MTGDDDFAKAVRFTVRDETYAYLKRAMASMGRDAALRLDRLLGREETENGLDDWRWLDGNGEDDSASATPAEAWTMSIAEAFPTDAEVGIDNGVGIRSPIKCDGCPLAPTRNGFVPGCGPKNARLILVGEAPGREEIAQGVPFIGPSGKIIRRGLDTAATYITNIRKCLPPPLEGPAVRNLSIRHCVAHYLQSEFDALTEARAIQAVGADAAVVLAGVTSVMEAHGAVFTRLEADAIRGLDDGI